MTEGKQILTMFSSADEAIVVGEGKSKSQDLCNIISPTQKGLEEAIFAPMTNFSAEILKSKFWVSAKRLDFCVSLSASLFPSPVSSFRRTYPSERELTQVLGRR